jgi:IMP cyclohydrolase
MYIGRIVAVGMTPSGKAAAMYRVSSRSFPNRECALSGETVSVRPRPGFEADLMKSPYITYNCIRLAGRYAIVSNGSHTDPIAEKIVMGMSPRDAITLGLLAMDYEKDSYNTPRIVAVADTQSDRGFLGIIRHDAVLVQEVPLKPGQAWYLSTYEKNEIRAENTDTAFTAESAAECCAHIVGGGAFAEFELPVTAAAAVVSGLTSFELNVRTV